MFKAILEPQKHVKSWSKRLNIQNGHSSTCFGGVLVIFRLERLTLPCPSLRPTSLVVSREKGKIILI